MRIAGYCATRNLYPRLVVAVNSLLKNNHVDTVYCFLEDDSLKPLEHPNVKIVNVNRLKDYFWRFSPNYNTVFTSMALIRLAFAKYLPDVGKILYMDVDTIVDDDISELFDMDVDGFPVAGMIDPCISDRPEGYINAGVMVMNLDFIREHKLDDRWIEMINSNHRYLYPDQDVLNEVCLPNIKHFGMEYNCFAHLPCQKPKIVHYAGFRNWWDGKVQRSDYYNKYRCISI